MGVGIKQNSDMKTRQVLADNFKKLRGASVKLYRYPDITKAGGPTNGTLSRIGAQQVSAGVDSIEQLAGVYGLEPWQLLVPTLTVQAQPGGQFSRP